MPLPGWRAALSAALILLPALPCAHADERRDEPWALLETGGAGEWSSAEKPSFGPAVGLEIEPIENWLEIEIGTSFLSRQGGGSLETDILFKKPFTLGDGVEFMAGIGPSWTHGLRGDETGDGFGIEAAGDFMIWPWEGRRLGWYIEPSYGYSLAGNHERTAGLGIGLIIPLR